jgi:pimeloyl-ACP methyl ester carboxylesterase
MVPAVLVIHGAGSGFDQGLDLAQPLVRRGFRVIAMSRFGYLRTPLPADASPEAQADAHACLLDALGVKQAAVIGGSAGAPSAIQLALRHPERCSALVLLFPMTWAPRPAGAGPSKPPALLAFVMKTTLHYERRDGVVVLYAGNIDAQHAGAFFDIALRELLRVPDRPYAFADEHEGIIHDIEQPESEFISLQPKGFKSQTTRS